VLHLETTVLLQHNFCVIQWFCVIPLAELDVRVFSPETRSTVCVLYITWLLCIFLLFLHFCNMCTCVLCVRFDYKQANSSLCILCNTMTTKQLSNGFWRTKQKQWLAFIKHLTYTRYFCINLPVIPMTLETEPRLLKRQGLATLASRLCLAKAWAQKNITL